MILLYQKTESYIYQNHISVLLHWPPLLMPLNCVGLIYTTISAYFLKIMTGYADSGKITLKNVFNMATGDNSIKLFSSLFAPLSLYFKWFLLRLCLQCQNYIEKVL